MTVKGRGRPRKEGERRKKVKGQTNRSNGLDFCSHEVLKGVVRAERLKSPSDYIHEADSDTVNYTDTGYHFFRSENSEEKKELKDIQKIFDKEKTKTLQSALGRPLNNKCV